MVPGVWEASVTFQAHVSLVVCPLDPSWLELPLWQPLKLSLNSCWGAIMGLDTLGPLSPWKHLPSITATLFPSKSLSLSLPALGLLELSVNLGVPQNQKVVTGHQQLCLARDPTE